MNAKPLLSAVHKRKRKRPTIWSVLIYIVMTSFAFACLFPLIYEFLLSVSSQDDFLKAKFLVWPSEFNIEMYKLILFQDRIGKAFFISTMLTVIGLIYAMSLNVLGAYVLSKRDLPGRNIFFTMLLITMFFSGGLIPFYLTLRSLHLTNNYIGLILPFGGGAFNMILLRNFFAQVPSDVIDSCKMDGASDFRVLWQFILPLSKAGLATISLFTMVGKWNDWYWPMILLIDDDKFPLALELRNVLSAARGDQVEGGVIDMDVVYAQGKNAAMIIVSLLPIIVVYPFLQKYFVKGVMIGAVKS